MSVWGKAGQGLLLLVGALGLMALGSEIWLSVAALSHGAQPVRVVDVQAGPYPLRVSLYKDPAEAGFALPFAVAPRQAGLMGLTYNVVSEPGFQVDATPVRAGLSSDAALPGGIQGAAELPVSGPWTLRLTVDGPAGRGEATVPLTVTAPPAIPHWLGWALGLLPLAGLLVFLLAQRGTTVQRSAGVAGIPGD